MYAGTNITGIRFFDPESQEIQDMVKFWNNKEKERGAEEIAAETLLVIYIKIWINNVIIFLFELKHQLILILQNKH